MAKQKTFFSSVAQGASKGAKWSALTTFTAIAGVAMYWEAQLLINGPKEPNYVTRRRFGLYTETVDLNAAYNTHVNPTTLLMAAVVFGLTASIAGCAIGGVTGGIAHCISTEENDEETAVIKQM
jgi:hypothetical protein